jgi:hypothetical protein
MGVELYCQNRAVSSAGIDKNDRGLTSGSIYDKKSVPVGDVRAVNSALHEAL